MPSKLERKLLLARHRCPWCSAKITEVTIRGPVAKYLPHSQTCLRFCINYHHLDVDSWPRSPLRTRLEYDDANGELPVEIVELIDALRHALARVALLADVPDVDRAAAEREAAELGIRSCRTLQTQLLER